MWIKQLVVCSLLHGVATVLWFDILFMFTLFGLFSSVAVLIVFVWGVAVNMSIVYAYCGRDNERRTFEILKRKQLKNPPRKHDNLPL